MLESLPVSRNSASSSTIKNNPSKHKNVVNLAKEQREKSLKSCAALLGPERVSSIYMPTKSSCATSPTSNKTLTNISQVRHTY